MKSKIYHMAICAGLLLLAGCDKNCSPEPDPCEVNPADCDTIGPVTKLDIVWKILVNPDTSFVLADLKLISTGLLGNFSPAGNAFLQLHDIDNEGAVKWRWQGFQRDHFTTTAESGTPPSVLCKSWRDRAVIDPTAGQTIQYLRSAHDSNPRAWVVGDRLFFDEYTAPDTAAWLLMAPLNDLSQVDTVYWLRASVAESKRKSIESLNVWVHPQTGDSILIFQHRMAIPNRVDVVAWNMTKRRVEWRHDDIEPNGNSSVRQVFIYADKAYFQGVNTIYCFRLANGEILWQHRYLNPLNSFLHGNIVYASQEDLILVKGDGSSLIAYRPETGAVVWQKNDIEYGGAIMTYHDGIVYFANDRLIAVRASNGQVIWSERSPSRVTQPTFSGTVAIDTERKLLYACDQYYVMAIRLPE